MRTGDDARQRLLAAAGLAGARVEPLAGDASTRRYLRVRDAGRSAILVEHPEPLPPGGGPVDALPFERWRRFLRDLGVRVPDLLGEDRPAGLLLLEDLGDELLQDRVEARGAAACTGLYERAVDLARSIADDGTACFEPDAADSDDPLVPARLAWEMDFLLRHALGLGPDADWPADGPVATARALLHGLCEDAHAPPAPDGARLALCHRDFHARNLLVVPGPQGEDLAVIDFQDTRRGPRSYDVASLLFDPYVDLEASLVATLRERARPRATAPADWAVEVDLVAAQRLFKAAGSYAWLAGERGLARFGRWLPIALERAARRLESARWPHRDELAAALDASGLHPDG